MRTKCVLKIMGFKNEWMCYYKKSYLGLRDGVTLFAFMRLTGMRSAKLGASKIKL